MTRPRIDADDRKVLGTAGIVALGFVLLCLVIGGGLGLGVRMFWLMAGGG